MAQTPILAQSAAERVTQAGRDWNAGRYDVALTALAEVLRAPGNDAVLPDIARLTGEPYRTVTVSTALGTSAWRPRWASDNTHIAYETGTGNNVRTHIATVGESVRTVATVEGRGLVFSPDVRAVVYIGRGDGGAPIVRARALGTGQEQALATGAVAISELAFASDGGALYAIGTVPNAPAQVYMWREGSMDPPTPVTTSDSTKSDLIVVPGGRHLIYSIRAGAPVGGARGNVAGGGASFEVFDLTTRTARRFAGRNVAVARDGSAITYLAGGGGGGRGGRGGRGGASEPAALMRLSLQPLGEPQQLFATNDGISSPAISPDGNRVAFQMMPREDWELYTVVADSAPVRLTHEIQHDLSPQFLSNTTVLGLIGEARHRRSHTYDIATRERTKIFHNNSVRTIAPEYDWVPSPNGQKVLIVAERDGDTVTPHRFLYCTDLGRPVTRAELVSRVDSALTAERALRAYATRSFQPIDAQVRAAVNDVDVGRIYEHARILHSFDSKHITQPGNAKAREYLLGAYRSFGYSDARFQSFDTPAGGGGRGGRGAGPGNTIETANVIAVLRGTENPELVYVVGSHFDSVQPGPGADDNSSGTTALLEAARVLARRPQPATIMFVSFTGEEAGLRGSREFVRQAQQDSMKLVGALNNDMIGFANDERLDNTIRYSNAGIKDVQHAAAIRFTNLITYDAFYYKSTDAAAFYDAYGDIVGGIGSYPVLGNPHYHQSHDVLETINQQLVAEVSKTTVATLMYLASAPSRLVNLAATRSGSALELTWTPSPERSVVRYVVRFRRPNATEWIGTAVTAPRIRLADAPPGTLVEVRAVNSRGLEGWDWARLTAQ